MPSGYPTEGRPADWAVGYFGLLAGFGRFLIFLSAASFASAARLSFSYKDMLSG
jgi:hypothetical protein